MTKTSSLGIVTIAPNEYVVHTRLGKIKNQGLGKTFLLYPFIDSYIKFSITPRKINFYADNITLEKQGVGIDGFLIWSIEDGEKAYKKIGDSDSTSLDSLSLQLIDIAVSIARNAISNMILDEVLKNREVLVEKLSLQLSNVIVDWGLKIETIEIKEVRILSETLFESMQAPFRNEQLKLAEHSRLEAKQSIETATAETEVAVRIIKSQEELEARRIEIDNQDKQKIIEHEAMIRQEERTLEQNIKYLENQNKEKITQKTLEKEESLIEKDLIIITEDARRTVIKEKIETEKQELNLLAENQLLFKQNEIKLKDEDLQFINRDREAEVAYKLSINDIENNLSQEALMKVLYNEIGNSLNNMNFDKIQWYSMGDNSPMGTLPKTIMEIVATLQGTGILKQPE